MTHVLQHLCPIVFLSLAQIRIATMLWVETFVLVGLLLLLRGMLEEGSLQLVFDEKYGIWVR